MRWHSTFSCHVNAREAAAWQRKTSTDTTQTGYLTLQNTIQSYKQSLIRIETLLSRHIHGNKCNSYTSSTPASFLAIRGLLLLINMKINWKISTKKFICFHQWDNTVMNLFTSHWKKPRPVFLFWYPHLFCLFVGGGGWSFFVLLFVSVVIFGLRGFACLSWWVWGFRGLGFYWVLFICLLVYLVGLFLF